MFPKKTIARATTDPSLRRDAIGTLGHRINLGVGAIGVVGGSVGLLDMSPVATGIYFGLASVSAVALRSPQIARRRHERAVQKVEAAKLAHFDSQDIPIHTEQLPDEIKLGEGIAPVDTREALEILRDLQTQHLETEVAAEYKKDHPSKIDPTMVIKGALHSLPNDSRESFLLEVVDQAVEINKSTAALRTFGALAVSETGQKALEKTSLTLVTALSKLALRFTDLKAPEVLPHAQNLLREASEPEYEQAATEAVDSLGAKSTLSLKRYEFATASW